ncbi:MAG: HipA N-terminal domain-containing protein [Candidatus Margulisiibacteriota bacterium]
MEQKAIVYVHDQKAGILSKDQSGYTFQYNKEYLAQGKAEPASLSLPLQEQPFCSPDLFPFFDNLIQEGWLKTLSETILHIADSDRFNLLVKNGQDCIGSVSLKEANG